MDAGSKVSFTVKPDQLIFANTANSGLCFCNSSETTIEGVFAGYAVGSTIISPTLSRYCTTHTPRLQSINARICLFIAHQSVRPSSAASSFRRCRFIPGDHRIRLPSRYSAVCARTLTRFLFASLSLAVALAEGLSGLSSGHTNVLLESLFRLVFKLPLSGVKSFPETPKVKSPAYSVHSLIRASAPNTYDRTHLFQ
jgi:hypothetical protein